MLARHVETEADMTIPCLEVPVEEAAGAFGVMIADADGRIRGFEEKPAEPTPIPGRPGYCLASMGNYVVNTEFLYQELSRDAYLASSGHDFGNDIIPAIIENARVFSYPFRDPATGKEAYWRDVGTVDAYWDANMELVAVEPELDIYDSDWPILTHQGKLPPAKVVSDRDGHRATVVDSVMSGGCVISGAELERTLLFSNVRVHSYVHLNDSVVLPDVEVHRHARIHRAVIDRGCVIPEGMVIGEDHDEDRRRGFRVSDKGIVLVTPDMLGQNIHRAG
jgi:glucose-1-phosphate adenylyltransferase